MVEYVEEAGHISDLGEREKYLTKSRKRELRKTFGCLCWPCVYGILYLLAVLWKLIKSIPKWPAAIWNGMTLVVEFLTLPCWYLSGWFVKSKKKRE